MIIKFWGARGSIPVCGKQFLKYGGNTTCVQIIDKDKNQIVIDAGTGIKNLGQEILKNKIKKINMLFTHQHLDHIVGFPFFAPIYENIEIIVRGCTFSNYKIREIIAKIMQPPSFPVNFEEIEAKFKFEPIPLQGFSIGNIKIYSIALSHPNGGLGYKFEEGNKKFVFLTDNELNYTHYDTKKEDYIKFSLNADFLIHDADYTEKEYKKRKTWGHSTWKQALDLAIKSNVKNLGLFHHNQDRTDKEIDEIVKKCNKILKSKNKFIKCFAVREKQVIKI